MTAVAENDDGWRIDPVPSRADGVRYIEIDDNGKHVKLVLALEMGGAAVYHPTGLGWERLPIRLVCGEVPPAFMRWRHCTPARVKKEIKA